MLTLKPEGAERRAGLALPVLPALEAMLAAVSDGEVGVRLHGLPGLAPLLASDGPIGGAVAQCFGGGAQPVRAILFDKNDATNWALDWHQDRTIAVDARHNVPGYGRGRSSKASSMSRHPSHCLRRW